MAFLDYINKSVIHPIVLFEFDLPIDNDAFVNYEAGIWRNIISPGDKSWTDDGDNLWYYSNTNTTKYNIQSLKIGLLDYTKVDSLADLRLQDASFYYNPLTTEIFIHIEDWEPPLDKVVVWGSVTGFSTEADREQGAYYEDVYYDPRIKSIPSLTIKKDPLFFGKISFNSGSVSLINNDGHFDTFEELNAFRQAARIKFGFEGDGLSEFKRIFTGYLENYDRSFTSFSVQIQDIRKSLSRPTPNEYFTIIDYPDIDPDNVEEVKPLAYGYVRKAPLICLNELGDPIPDYFEFMLADTTNHSIHSVSSIWEDGVDITDDLIDYSVDLDTGILSINSNEINAIGDMSATFYGFVDDDGDIITNALDVIKDLMYWYGDISFIASNFDLGEWNLARSDATDIGIFINENEELIDIIGNIVASTHGNFFSNIDGLYSCRIFDEDRTPAKTIENYEWLKEPKISNSGSEFLSSIKILYDQDLTEEEFKTYLNTNYEDDAVSLYKAYQQKELETLLYNESDALVLSNLIMSQSSEIKDIIQRTVKMAHYDLELGDFIIGNPNVRPSDDTTDFGVWEIIGKAINFNKFEINLTMKYIKDYVESEITYTQGYLWGDNLFNHNLYSVTLFTEA